MVSVLLALSADAWWDSRQEAARGEGHVSALARDFEQMSDRVDASLEVSANAVASGTALLGALRADGGIEPDSALHWLKGLFFYEVFSPSVGAYDALVASGDMELLADAELKRLLAAFFGSFQDLRVSEDALRAAQHGTVTSEEFIRLVGNHRLGYGQLDLPTFDQPPVQTWAQSDHLLSTVTLLTGYQADVLDDYEYLRARIDEIQGRLDRLQEPAS